MKSICYHHINLSNNLEKITDRLDTSPLRKVYTAGGGAKNEVWTQIRQRQLKVSVINSKHSEAAYGTAILAKG